jgi:sigma-B regulation protein RsbU (phosphoserine phosphatase)
MDALVCEPSFDVVLIDLNYTRDTTSGLEGLELLSRIRALDPDIPVVAMTAWGSIELAVDAMRTGVDDFVQKPWDNDRLLGHLRTQLRSGRARRQRRTENASSAYELSAARDIQRNLLPRVLPSMPGVEIAAFWEPAGNVGGDFYDVGASDARRVWLCIGDVEGKGMSAALLMASVQSTVHSSAERGLMPAALCAGVNADLCGRVTAGRFVSFFYCTYDTAQRRLVSTNAGHNPPVLVRRDGTVRRLGRGGPLLGVFAQAGFEQEETQLEDGDRLVLFTDGITEARDRTGCEFGEDRLASRAAAVRGSNARELQGELVSEIRAFSQGSFSDDATLIVMSA